MRITKFGHACVRLEHDGRVVVIDPGVFTQPEALDGADAVLITHEHPDHYHPATLALTDAPIFTIEAVADQVREGAPDLLERLTMVEADDELEAGLPVRVVGELHAVIHHDLPRFFNSGYVVRLGELTVYHPGDALVPPPHDVDVLCVPVCAPWLKASEAIEFAREVRAPRNLAVHDRVYSDWGLGVVDGHFGRLLREDQEYFRIPDGTDL